MPFQPAVEPLFIADHPALDFLNTIAVVGDSPADLLQCDADVVYWLKRVGFLQAELSAVPSALLSTARRLREMIRPLVLKRKSGKPIDPIQFNEFLTQAVSYPQLVAGPDGVDVERHRPIRTAAQLLAPVAESAAEFLATADFTLVRPCEGKDCVLWFYDRTKSHRRRWCSMQVCGNRHKVEAFRERQRA